MFFNKNFFCCLLFLFVFCIEQMQTLSRIDDEVPTKKVERKLSRKKRYLIFPVGSSIQLVYDQTITIPDYTLYVTTGITVALAYGLPDKPTYPEQELMEQYENGKLPLLLRKEDKNVTDLNRKGEIKASTASSNIVNKPNDSSYSNHHYNGNDVMNRIANYYKYLQRRKPDSYYFGNSPLNPANFNKNTYCNTRNCSYNTNSNYYYSNVKDYNRNSDYNSMYNVRPPYSSTYGGADQYNAFAKYLNNTYFQPWLKSATQMKTTTIQPPKATSVTVNSTKSTKNPDLKPVINKLHTVYVAMGKRSVRDASLSFEEKFYLDHHRNTRHKLYEMIEKYLFAKGYNGTECVLKTLCEVGQKRHETEPGSFLAEIVRVVFSLPVAQLQRVVHKRHIDYDDAHQTTVDCVAKYSLCPDSIWNAEVIMARKHSQLSTLCHSSLVVVFVGFPARKLIIFMLMHLVLSPFILITTADTLNGSSNNNNNQASVPDSVAKQQFGSALNVNAKLNCVKTKCTLDGSLTDAIQTNADQRKSANGNSILKQSNITEHEEQPYDVDLSTTENASIHNQSRQTNPSSESQRTKRDDRTFNKDGERVLSRKRRYLIFPPGSSMQIVYDTYHPIVGYSNYLTLGITAAMAWELPSEPIYLDEQLRDQYEMGELPLLHRNDKNVTNVQYVLPSKKNAADANHINYYTNIPKEKFTNDKNQYQSPSKSYYQSGYKPSSYMAQAANAQSNSNKIQQYISYADSLMKQFKKITEKIPQNRPLSTKDFQEFTNILSENVKANRKVDSNYQRRTNYAHIIHPAFKKRSIDELTPLEKFDLNLHRNSRHALYKQINTFLKTQGSKGDQCVLKMLCETGQRKHNVEPESMVVELLRTVFTLPEPLEPTTHPMHGKYDEAHASTENCQQLYPDCKESVWNSKYK
ncbi:uncharacterized protein LOC116349064 [Contarinia nasturtii]|uniref:uncharacterized protein LOC116349064 n=1 Tax=Contarinia nasturtii TaxID=265458 RepID=UPI0012D3A989|nr:uncharacterized protein LOC116349064 [Contarinia nasturtii]